MKALLAVAGGGALGAVARYLTFIAAGHVFGTAFPYGTLIVNVAGSFAIGALTEVMALVWSASTQTRLFLVVGFLGAFTTFSTFSLDFVVLYERGRLFLCALYVGASVIASIGALFLGMWILRRALAPVL